MPAVAVIGTLISAAVGVAGVVQQKNMADDQKRQMQKQEERVKNEAMQEKPLADTGATVKLGTPAPSQSRKGTVSNAIGGITASKRLGL